MRNFNAAFQLNAITLNIANGCNLQCAYCFESQQTPERMLPQDATRILDISYTGFKETYPEMNYFMINLFGGEPLMNWEAIKALADHIRSRKYKARIGITTNLTLLTDEMIDYIEEHEMFILASIDGIKKIHDRNRSGSYDVVKKNVDRLVARELCYLLEARMTVLPQDAPFLVAGVKNIVDMGIHNIAPVPVTDVLWKQKDLDALRASMDGLFDYYLSIANDPTNRKNIAIKLIDDYILDVLEPIRDEIEPCTAGTNRWCSIGVNGDIMPCHQRHTLADHVEDLKIGNILTDQIDQSKIKRPEYRTTRESQRCRECAALSVCRGGCPSENLTQTGDWHTPTKAWCDTMLVIYDAARANHKKVLSAVNLRDKQLNLLKSNLEIKMYFDRLCDMDIENPDFGIYLNKFYMYMEEYDEILFPSFRKYFMKKLYPLYSWYQTLTNENIAAE